ncbi:MAG: aldehyde dehydrogenase family protein [Acidobacteria bacterium]|nr:aldehyde dehydrogenase family protein [Acidobacteriota bacterium]
MTVATASTEFLNLIDGRFVAGRGWIEDRNPADTRELVGLFARGSADDMRAAVDAAARAFPAWAGMPAPGRGECLFRAAEILDASFELLATDMTREEGKTLPEARGEVRRAINIFRYFGGEGARQPGLLAPSERDRVFSFAIRKPLGVVGLITPWNFPSAIPAWKLAPALVAGNTVVLKPASAAPLSSWRLVDALVKAGVPAGVVNFVAGPGRELGHALVEADPTRAVSFTGSCAVGATLYDQAVGRRLRVQLEMGGKNPTVVLADADLERAVDNTINGAFASTGQKCTATSRVIVEAPIHDRFVERLVARARGLKVGPGMDPATEIGPAIDADQLNTVLQYVAAGVREGATLACGGRRLEQPPCDHGFFVEPAVFVDVHERMTIAQDEIFGPVLAVFKARDFDDAMRLANDVPFGLSASVQTQDVGRVFDFVNRIEAGLVTVNLPSAGVEYQLPFGGTRQSSFGPKEQGPNALDFYTDWKTVYLRY